MYWDGGDVNVLRWGRCQCTKMGEMSMYWNGGDVNVLGWRRYRHSTNVKWKVEWMNYTHSWSLIQMFRITVML